MQREPRDVTCKVHNCRFKFSHTTIGHKCGECGDYGHGVMECKRDTFKNYLRQYHQDKFTDVSTFCNRPNCPTKDTHMSVAHLCPYCNVRNHDSEECIITHNITRINTIPEAGKLRRFLRNYNNVYIMQYAGMGCRYYIKKVDTLSAIYIHADCLGQYGPETDDSPILYKFIEGLIDVSLDIQEDPVVNDGGDDGDNGSYSEPEDSTIIKCPLCRTENNKTEILNIKGSSESCSVCYDNNVDKYFSKCEHACVCNSCYKKL